MIFFFKKIYSKNLYIEVYSLFKFTYFLNFLLNMLS